MSVQTASDALGTVKKASVQQPPWTQPGPQSRPGLRLYNSLTRQKNEFVPLRPGHILWYCCGPTVYSHTHMGHARNYVTTDINRRILQDYFGYLVQFIQNVTDIDDKIIVAARQEHLYETRVLGRFSAVKPELVEHVRNALALHTEENLASFASGADVAAAVALGALAAHYEANPKLPMHVRAYESASAALDRQDQLSFSEFAARVKDVVMPYLDRHHGSSVTDPAVFRDLAAYWEHKFDKDMARLNVLPSSVTTRVSEYIPDIIGFVEAIVENGFAYTTADGSVYFDTVAFESHPNHSYAKLQPWNKGAVELINDGEGSLSTGGAKKNAPDFALWKASKPGEPAWPSPWGAGRPGWHIECSVMASDLTGSAMDIHSGGVDLCFPHHDNELAQSEAFFDNRQWVNYFLHCGHLHIRGQKMSKSLKNFITVEEALQTYSARQLRLAFALSQWEKPLDFKDTLIAGVKGFESSLSKFFTTVRALNAAHNHAVLSSQRNTAAKKPGQLEKRLYGDLARAQDEVHAAFSDNLLTPQALRSVQELVSRANGYIQEAAASGVRLEALNAVTKWAVRILEIVGFEARGDRLGWSDGSAAGALALADEEAFLPYVRALSRFRDEVRALAINKQPYAELLRATDEIRALLVELNVSLDDRQGGALVKVLNDREKRDLVEQQQQREAAVAAKGQKRLQQQEAAAKKEQARVEKLKTDPKTMFRDPSLYSEWDEQGIPTRDIRGEEVSKSARKKLTKLHQQQEKLHSEYLGTL